MTTEIVEQSVAEKEALTLTEQARKLSIVTNEDRIDAERLLENLSAAEKAIFAYLDPPRAKSYEVYQYHKNRLDEAINPVKQAKKYAKEVTMKWDGEQERKRREEQMRLEAEARKRAEDEALTLAAQAEAEGDKEAAEAILTAPVETAPVFVPSTAPAATRLSAGRSMWSAEVVNLMALVKAVAEGKQPITLLEANTTALNGLARSLKKAFNVPGCRALERKV